MSVAAAAPERRLPAPTRTYAAGAVAIAALAAPLAMALVLDGRAVDAMNPWIKPLKFALSLTVYLGSLALYARWLPARASEGAVRPFALAVVALSLLEMAWLISASAAGVRSHYNTGMPWIVLYPAAGAGATVIAAASLVHGISFLRNPSGLPRALQLGLGLGLVITFPLTFVVAGMLSQLPFHHVGVEPAGAATWPLFGWSTTVGDPRPAHFLATHALNGVPLVALAACWLVPAAAAPIAVAAAVLWTALTLAAFAQTMAGVPFLYPLV